MASRITQEMHELIVEWWTEGWTVREICAELEINQATVYRHLDLAKLDRLRRPGAGGAKERVKKRRNTHCFRNHEYTPENTRVRSDGKRNCLLCEKIAARIREQERQSVWM